LDLPYKPELKSNCHQAIKTFAALPKPMPSQKNDSESKQPDDKKPPVVRRHVKLTP
jgi:hypothetical protein